MMRKYESLPWSFNRFFLVLMICGPMAAMLAGCDFGGVKFETTQQRTVPCPDQTHFDLQTHNGAIKIRGADTTNCDIKATIVARAPTEQEAQQLAEQVELQIQRPADRNIIVRAKKPKLRNRQSISVNFEVTLPKDINLTLNTHNGSIGVYHTRGHIRLGKTHNGSITIEDVPGQMKLQTHNGSINIREAAGNIQARTHNGRVVVACSADAPPTLLADITTHNGSIIFTAPKEISAQVDISTHNGSINSELPVTVSGKLNKRNIQGTIGTGQGKLRLSTHNGSITIKKR
ncbi:MAG: DUF4097 family beta strand repeat-containing protein [Planctomycetota bacterium]|jgi:DUF4097 and DUF4098 domain-containing protein YvlB